MLMIFSGFAGTAIAGIGWNAQPQGNVMGVNRIPIQLGWISPDGHYDYSGDWRDEEYAYDGDTNSKARSYQHYNQLYWDWTGFLELTLNHPIKADKIRFWAWYDYDRCNKIDIDLYYDGEWHDLISGPYNDRYWEEVDFGSPISGVTKARVRFQVRTFFWEFVVADLHEFQFNRIL